ncbi:hypothetical protein Pelo_17821 [Pelomyxa schiedti]|nr:hypothetical protein Pelo_17821 [Pelomyxa schiedti]
MTAYTATSGTSAMTSSILTPGAVTSTLTSCEATSTRDGRGGGGRGEGGFIVVASIMTPSFQRGTVQNFFRIDLTGEPANTHLDDSIARSQRALELLTNAPIERPHAVSTNRFDKMQSFQNYPRRFYNVTIKHLAPHYGISEDQGCDAISRVHPHIYNKLTQKWFLSHPSRLHHANPDDPLSFIGFIGDHTPILVPRPHGKGSFFSELETNLLVEDSKSTISVSSLEACQQKGLDSELKLDSERSATEKILDSTVLGMQALESEKQILQTRCADLKLQIESVNHDYEELTAEHQAGEQEWKKRLDLLATELDHEKEVVLVL